MLTVIWLLLSYYRMENQGCFGGRDCCSLKLCGYFQKTLISVASTLVISGFLPTADKKLWLIPLSTSQEPLLFRHSGWNLKFPFAALLRSSSSSVSTTSSHKNNCRQRYWPIVRKGLKQTAWKFCGCCLDHFTATDMPLDTTAPVCREAASLIRSKQRTSILNSHSIWTNLSWA